MCIYTAKRFVKSVTYSIFVLEYWTQRGQSYNEIDLAVDLQIVQIG